MCIAPVAGKIPGSIDDAVDDDEDGADVEESASEFAEGETQQQQLAPHLDIFLHNPHKATLTTPMTPQPRPALPPPSHHSMEWTTPFHGMDDRFHGIQRSFHGMDDHIHIEGNIHKNMNNFMGGGPDI